MRRLLAAFATAIAMGFGFLTLWGLLVGGGVVTSLANILLQLVVLTAAVTILIGIINLIGVHFGRVRHREHNWGYSVVVILTTTGVIALWLLDADAAAMMLLENVQVAIESALAGLILFALVFGAYRLLRRRVTWSGVLFTVSLLIILIGALPLRETAVLADVRRWLLAVPVSAGARGILLGIALAAVVTGVRVLIGQDRSYRE